MGERLAERRSLGRGLGAIIEEVEKAYEQSRDEEADLVQELDIELIEPNPFQPRKTFDSTALKELSESIKTYGLLQPIIVYEDDDRYVLIAGERRLRASKMAGLEKIKTIIAEIETKKLRELALIENIQREDLNAIELALSYRELIDEYDITHEELSKIVFKSRAQITNTIRLLSLIAYAQEALKENKISQGHAKILVGLDEEAQKMAVDSIVGQKLSVRELETMVRRLKTDQETKETAPTQQMFDVEIDTDAILPLQQVLKDNNIRSTIHKNRWTIEFQSSEDVQKIINIIAIK